MKFAVTSVLLAGLSNAQQTCTLVSVKPGSGVDAIAIADLVGFNNATLGGFELTLDGQAGRAGFVATSLEPKADADLAATADPLVLRITGPLGGTVTASDGTETCDFTIAFAPGKYFHASAEAYNYFDQAAKATGGTAVGGEFFLDDNEAQIHLNAAATETMPLSEQWFVVPSGGPASLTVAPTNKNKEYKPYVVKDLISEVDAVALQEQYGTLKDLIGEYIWVTPTVANQTPFVDDSGAYQYGKALAIKGLDGSRATLKAEATAFVLSTKELVDVGTPITIPTPAPKSDSTTTTKATGEEETTTVSSAISQIAAAGVVGVSLVFLL